MAVVALGLSQGAGHGDEPKGAYPWENNTLGKEETVPPPWTPLVREGDVLKVWGRAFSFADRAWPAAITTQNREVWSSPPELTLRTAGGSLAEAVPGPVVFGEVGATRAAVTQTTVLPDAEVKAACTVEFDGFCKIEIEVVPTSGDLRLEEFVLTFTFPAEFARTFSRFVDYDFETQRLDRADFARSFGRLDEVQEFAFNPAVWVGNSRTGIEWSCETDYGWSPRQAKNAIRLEPRDGQVIMRVAVVGKAVTSSEPFRFVCALYPTPVKPRYPDARAVRLLNGWSYNGPDGEVPAGLKPFGLAWHAKFPVRHTGQPGFAPAASEAAESRIKQGLERMRQRGIKVIQYGSLYGLPPVLPNDEWKSYADEWLADGLDKMPRNPLWARNAGLPADTPSIRYISLAPESIRDMIVWSHVRALEADGTDGLYFDLSSPNMLSRNPRHPFGDWVAQGGVYYPFFAQRELMMRLYRALKGRKPDYLITQHHAKVPVVVSGFTDVVLMGEGLNMFFRSPDWTIEAQATDPAAYVPDYGNLSPEIFATEFNQNRGAIYMLLPQILKRNEEALAAKDGLFARYTSALLARCAVYDVPLMSVRVEPGLLRRYEKARERAGWLLEDDYFDPVEARRFFRGDSALERSVYLDPQKRRIVLALGNLTEEQVSATPDLETAALREAGVEPGPDWRVFDAFHDEDLGVLGDSDGRPFQVAPDSFRLLVVQPPEA